MLLLVFQLLEAKAQNLQWNKLGFGHPNSSSYTRSRITIDETNNKYLVGFFEEEYQIQGTTINSTPNETTIYVAKFSPSDELLWIRTIARGEFSNGFSIECDSEGSLYINLGITTDVIIDSELQTTNGSLDNVLIKISSSGDFVYSKAFGGACEDGTLWNGLSIDINNNVYISGIFGSWGSNCEVYVDGYLLPQLLPNNDDGDIFIIKYSSTGQLIWAKTAGSPGFYDNSVAIDTKDLSIFLSGIVGDNSENYFDSLQLIYPSQFNSLDLTKGYIAKYDTAGNAQWVKGFASNGGGSNVLSIRDIITAPNNTITVLIMQKSGNISPMRVYVEGLDEQIEAKTTSLAYDYFLINYDLEGNVNWTNSSNSAGEEFAVKLATDNQSNIYVTGSYNADITFAGEVHEHRGGNGDIYVAKYNSQGEEVWLETAGGAGYDVGLGVVLDSDQKIYVCGGTTSNPTTFGDIVETPPAASNMFYARLSDDPILAINHNELFTISESISVYPNPATTQLHIKSENHNTIIKSINITNISGKQIWQQSNLSSNAQQINCGNWPNGVYLLQAKTKNNIHHQKIIIQH